MNSVNENIDSRILILLGLEDVFDLDYSTYATLLKEKLIEVTRGKNKIPAAEAKLLIDEFKRVRNKEGRLKPKSKKVRVQNVTNLGNMKRLPGGGALAKYNPQTGQPLTRKEQQEEKRNQQKQNINANKISDIFSNIRNSFSSIGKTLKNQLTLDRSIQRYQKRKTENLKREKTEELIEERKTEKKAVDRENKQKKKVGEGPLAKFIDAIKRFIGFTVLGRMIKLIEDILKEEDRFNTVVKFLKELVAFFISSVCIICDSFGWIDYEDDSPVGNYDCKTRCSSCNSRGTYCFGLSTGRWEFNNGNGF